MKARVAPHLVLALGVGLAGMVAALALETPMPVAMGAPFLLLGAVGLLAPVPTIDRLDVRLVADRVVVGNDLGVRVSIGGQGLAWVDVRAEVVGGLEPTSASHVILQPGAEATFRFRASQWGGGADVRITARGRGALGLRSVEATTRLPHALRIYPHPEALRRLLPPLALRGVGGSHPSRTRGEGFEYAESRPFAPGDRLRDVNWRISGRRPELWVDRRHPDLSGDVVLFIDSFASTTLGRDDTLGLAIDAATAIGRAHLSAQDRVGLVDLGGTLRWVTTGTGLAHTYRLVETLVESEVIETFADKDLDVIPTWSLPPRALVIALSPLADRRALNVLLQLRARRYDLAVIECLIPLAVGPTPDRVDDLARRLWALEHEAVRGSLRRAGASLVTWQKGDPLDPCIEALRTDRRRPHAVGV